MFKLIKFKQLTPFPSPNGCTDRYPGGKFADTGKNCTSIFNLNKSNEIKL